MFRLPTLGLFAASLVGLAGLGPAQPPANDPDAHPPAGHPMVPRPTAQWPKAKPEDVGSIESIVAAYYASTSGQPNQPRDWDRFQSLFLPDSRLVSARPGEGGASGVIVLPVLDYIEQNRKYFDRSGFIDRESAHRIESFGNIAQVWSTYESRRRQGDPEPYSRGIASIQLLRDADRWWIVTVFWDFQRPDNPIPEKYQKSPAKE